MFHKFAFSFPASFVCKISGPRAFDETDSPVDSKSALTLLVNLAGKAAGWSAIETVSVFIGPMETWQNSMDLSMETWLVFSNSINSDLYSSANGFTGKFPGAQITRVAACHAQS